MNDTLQDAALDAERIAKACVRGDASVADLSRALLLLRGSVTAREHRYGYQLTDGEGRLWEETLLALERMVRQASGRRQLRSCVRVVLRDLQPLSGSECREEECYA